MQDAYAQEKGAVGNWPEIGYSAPGTASTNKSEYTSNVFKYSGAATHNWIAQPKDATTKLNDCDNTEKWQLNSSITTSGEVKIEDGQSSPDCKILTASWSNLLKN